MNEWWEYTSKCTCSEVKLSTIKTLDREIKQQRWGVNIEAEEDVDEKVEKEVWWYWWWWLWWWGAMRNFTYHLICAIKMW